MFAVCMLDLDLFYAGRSLRYKFERQIVIPQVYVPFRNILLS